MLYQTKEEMLATLGASIRAARLSDNLSLETLAARSGISLTALRNLEGGRNASTVKHVSRINVSLWGQRVGTIVEAPQRGVYAFRYEKKHLHLPEGRNF